MTTHRISTCRTTKRFGQLIRDVVHDHVPASSKDTELKAVRPAVSSLLQRQVMQRADVGEAWAEAKRMGGGDRKGSKFVSLDLVSVTGRSMKAPKLNSFSRHSGLARWSLVRILPVDLLVKPAGRSDSTGSGTPTELESNIYDIGRSMENELDTNPARSSGRLVNRRLPSST